MAESADQLNWNSPMLFSCWDDNFLVLVNNITNFGDAMSFGHGNPFSRLIMVGFQGAPLGFPMGMSCF